MTNLTKPIRRRTATVVKGRRLVVELRPGAVDTVTIREEGRRRGYSVPVLKVYELGAHREAEQHRAERAAKRKKRKL